VRVLPTLRESFDTSDTESEAVGGTNPFETRRSASDSLLGDRPRI
jgi:hypothetical protein